MLVLIRILCKIKKLSNVDWFIPIISAHHEIGHNNPDHKIF